MYIRCWRIVRDRANSFVMGMKIKTCFWLRIWVRCGSPDIKSLHSTIFKTHLIELTHKRWLSVNVVSYHEIISESMTNATCFLHTNNLIKKRKRKKTIRKKHAPQMSTQCVDPMLSFQRQNWLTTCNQNVMVSSHPSAICNHWKSLIDGWVNYLNRFIDIIVFAYRTKCIKWVLILVCE